MIRKCLCLFFLVLFPLSPSFASNETHSIKFVKAQELSLWTETFGNSTHPALLLIHGAGCSGIAWPDALCQTLSQKGYFVIRYDHRDTGQSSSIDFEKAPYDLRDLAQDALIILDHYEVTKAHVVGLSMRGFIGQILAIEFPERLNRLVSMMSSPDHRVTMAAVQGHDTSTFPLPPPDPEALKVWQEMKDLPSRTLEEKIQRNLKNWRICSGSIGYDENECKDLETSLHHHVKKPEAAFNHWAAMIRSPSRSDALKTVKIPTLVIHGGHDRVLPLAHGIATAKAIPNSILKVIPEMGHAPCRYFMDNLVELICNHLKED